MAEAKALFSAPIPGQALSAELGSRPWQQPARYSNPEDALEFYGKNLGLTFQIADDTLDYNSDLNLFGKKIGNDFFEGKITLPIILLSQKANNLEKNQIEEFFSKKNRDEKNFQIILELIKKYNIVNECYKKAEHFINLASNSLNILENSEEKKIFENLTSFSLERSF